MKKIMLGLMLLISANTFAQFTAQQERQIDSLLDAFVKNRQFSGVVIVADKKKILYQRVRGMASREENIPNTLKTNFNIASMGKTFAAAMIMQLVGEGNYHSIRNCPPSFRVIQYEMRIKSRYVICSRIVLV
ncbi:MAG: serine hydrolase [Chitinophagaceae bacterium]|nr:serine hydrolase [Chitinophagaceae bacterium]